MDEIVTLCSAEVDILKDMIGFKPFRATNGKYHTHRNSLPAYKPNPVLERLCTLGICSKTLSELSCNIYYHLTEKGAELLSEYLFVTVVLQ